MWHQVGENKISVLSNEHLLRLYYCLILLQQLPLLVQNKSFS
jgi:hypothetical protein